jgi:hypothetical protein
LQIWYRHGRINHGSFTVKEIAGKLGLPPKTVKMRLYRAGIKPVTYAGPTAIYPQKPSKIVSGPRHRGPKPKAKA